MQSDEDSDDPHMLAQSVAGVNFTNRCVSSNVLRNAIPFPLPSAGDFVNTKFLCVFASESPDFCRKPALSSVQTRAFCQVSNF
jgi:hypothetical protein